MKIGSLFLRTALFLVAATSLRAQNLAQPVVAQDCGTAQSCTVQLGMNVTAGDALIAAVRLTAITSIAGTTITDSRSNAWILDAWLLQPGNLHILAIYRVISANAGSTTFTVSNAATSTTRILGLAEISGLAVGPPESQAALLGSGTTAQPGAVTTTQANDYVLLAAGTDNDQFYSAHTPFLVEAQATRGAYADAMVAQPTTLTPSISFGVSDNWFAIALAYKTTGTPRLPVFLTLHYDDGTPVAGSVVLSALAAGTKSTIQSSTINANGQIATYCPIVNTGNYEYDVLDPNGNLIQSAVILPGGFISLMNGAHSLTSAITINKSTHAVAIPVSFSFQ
jgi:hypothetical protein